jgi:hypothetical protein
MFTKYCCFIKQNIQVKNKDKLVLDKSHHFAYMKDGINSLMDIIEQKINQNIILNANELEYISNLDKEQMYKIFLCLYNKNNEKY